MAVSLDRLGRRDEAAIRDGREGLPATQRELPRVLHERGLMGEKRGEPAERIAPLFREAWELRRELFGNDSELTIEARTALDRVGADGE